MVDWTIQETSDAPVYPVTLGQAKEHLRLTDIGEPHDHNSMIADLIIAATEDAEAKTGRALVQRNFRYTQCAFTNPIELPVAPVQSITNVQYVDADGATQTLGTSVYSTDLTIEPAQIYLAYGQSWPTTRDQRGAVTVNFVGGYALGGNNSPADDYRAKIPKSIKQAILMMVEDMYEFSGVKIAGAGNTVINNDTVHNMLFKHKVWY